jgi:hypothetical protein
MYPKTIKIPLPRIEAIEIRSYMEDLAEVK